MTPAHRDVAAPAELDLAAPAEPHAEAASGTGETPLLAGAPVSTPGAAAGMGDASRRVDAYALARAFLRQTLAAEGDALMLEHLTRADVLQRLSPGGRRAAGGSAAVRAAGAGAASGAATASPATRSRSGTSGERGRDLRPRVGRTAGRQGRVEEPPTPPTSVEEIETAPDLAALEALVAACTRCALHTSRKTAVFGEGAPDARVVCVGEAPGAREDDTGRPFVGRAGRLLDELLLAIGLPRSSVYICNVLKSRPPRNRDPLPDEVAACSPYLLRQLALIRPEVIVAFGAFAARTLLQTQSPLGRLRGEVHRYAGYPVIVTYHPAALLRNQSWTRPTWEDLQTVRRMLDDGTPDRVASHG